MSEPLVLKWGNEHHLDFHFFESLSNVNLMELHLLKKWGNQVIQLMIPAPLTREIIEEAWESQRSGWIELRPNDDEPPLYRTVRVLYFAKQGICLFWHVMHFDETPFDACVFISVDQNMMERLTAAMRAS